MRRQLRPEVEVARRLRRAMTYPEVLLWQRLRGGAGGVRFRKQHPVGSYVVDFYGAAARLVIEVDGDIHSQSAVIEHDASRDRFLNENDYRVMRVAARDILLNADAVAASILALAARPLHRPVDGPPPRAGEDQE